ncbi:MAG TPA: DUF1801 domain-containing protein [Puia sp.]|nr:DUF1801 domain-containing protein [Puia sp.]
MMNSEVNKYISNAQKWRKELEQLRTVILDCGLNEELKWGCPCYCYLDKNILIIGELKDYCALSFFKGALLNDPQNILIQPGKNTQSARTAKFTSALEIAKMAPILKKYIYEAIEAEKKGLKVKFKKPGEFNVPEELQTKFKKSPALKKAFSELTPGRQRGYLLYFSAPKQSRTRESRIEKYSKHILFGKGLNE